MKNNKTIEAKLETLNQQIDQHMEEVTIDQTQINIALSKGAHIREKREMILNNVIFLIVAISVFALIGLVIAAGYINIVLVLQVLMIAIVPLMIPIAIKKQLKRGAL